jgi:hypothetical protein
MTVSVSERFSTLSGHAKSGQVGVHTVRTRVPTTVGVAKMGIQCLPHSSHNLRVMCAAGRTIS